MKRYHGSLEIVKEPRIIESSRTLDYGCGFYTTSSYEQADYNHTYNLVFAASWKSHPVRRKTY